MPRLLLTAVLAVLTTVSAQAQIATTYPVAGDLHEMVPIPTGDPSKAGGFTNFSEPTITRRAWSEPPLASPRSPFADRDHFLAELFAPGTDWLPPRTATPDAWRAWLFAAPREADPWTVLPPGPDGSRGWYRGKNGGIEYRF